MAHWSNSWKRPRFVMIDARVTFIVLISVVYWSVYLLTACLSAVAVLYYIERRRRMNLNAALRSIVTSFVTFIQGKRRPVLPIGQRNFFLNPYDYDTQNPGEGFAKAIPDLPDFDDPETFESTEEVERVMQELHKK